MNFSSMDYFIELARERNFTRAASRLHITQQSLSAHIASLEQELGTKLVIRTVPLELTYAGTVFLHYANSFRENYDTMVREFGDITKNQRGWLRIGVAFTRGMAIMPNLIEHFGRMYPNVRIELCERANQRIIEDLRNRDIDLAIALLPDSLPGVTIREFYREQIVLVIPDNLLKTLDRKSLDTSIRNGDLTPLKNCPFVLGNTDDIAGSYSRTLLARAGLNPQVRASSGNMQTLLELANRGIGACFAPLNLIRNSTAGKMFGQENIFQLGKDSFYPIRFGYLQSSYEWQVIQSFIDMAEKTENL